MLPPFDTDEAPPSGRLGSVYKVYRPMVDFLEQEGAMGLCMILALHIISTGLIMFLGGFLLAAPLWAVNRIPHGTYPSVAIQLGTVVAYFVVLVVPLPLWRTLRRFPGCQAAIITVISWEILIIRWFCVEDDRASRLSVFLQVPFVRNVAFLLATSLVIYAGTLAWSSSRASGSWPPRLWIVAVLGELFALQEFYRNGVPAIAMTSTALLYIAASLTLASLVHARSRGSGVHSGGTTYVSGTNDPSMDDLIQIGPWLIEKKWVIIGGVGIGLVVLAIVAVVFIKCALPRLKNRKAAAQQKAFQQQEAQRMEPTKGGAFPTEAWGHTWRPGPQQHYVQIQPAHDHTATASIWSRDSQQKLPYAQGGLGYTAHQSDPSIYHPPTPPAPYSIPYNPPHH